LRRRLRRIFHAKWALIGCFYVDLERWNDFLILVKNGSKRWSIFQTRLQSPSAHNLWQSGIDYFRVAQILFKYFHSLTTKQCPKDES
jgi:hypothetical protein